MFYAWVNVGDKLMQILIFPLPNQHYLFVLNTISFTDLVVISRFYDMHSFAIITKITNRYYIEFTYRVC